MKTTISKHGTIYAYDDYGRLCSTVIPDEEPEVDVLVRLRLYDCTPAQAVVRLADGTGLNIGDRGDGEFEIISAKEVR